MKKKRSGFKFLAIILLISLSACNKNKSIQASLDEGMTPLEIVQDGVEVEELYGKNYQGGLICYLDVVTGNGLIAATADISESWVNWGCSGVLVSGANETAIGSGNENTTAILNACEEAAIPAEYCSFYTNEGYDDWYLPAKDELNTVFINLRLKKFGDFSEAQYWSSSQVDAENVWAQAFYVGSATFTDGQQFVTSKDLFAEPRKTRPVRAF